ncbi:barstar family protein [Streptomyces sp. NPDC087263]|uniref:barstar family protein n=1 Tax=Streptomyces sp. NPDC087263 TaxID=3365773 RepID=UPI00380D2674
MESPKYLLVSYDTEADFNGDDGYAEAWSSCAEAEGLFSDPPRPERGTYELLGCALEGELRTAFTRARADGSAPLGLLVLEVLDKKGECLVEWELDDARVIDDRPCARDLALRDITVEASESVDNASDYPQCPPLSPGYRLSGAENLPWGTCKDLAHVCTGPPGPPGPLEPSLRLLGCSPSGALRAALDAGEEDLGHAKVLRLDAHGRTVQSAVEGELTAWIPSARGRGLVDLTLEPWSERPPTAASEVWDLWWAGRPSEPNVWAQCTAEGREFWLRTALTNHTYGEPDRPPGTTYHLDGRHITDARGFFCAIGEAVNGPGGYFGWGLDALNDCLRGRWGADAPFTLVWHGAHIARSCLGVTPHTGSRPVTFEELLVFFAEKHIDVRLA